MIATHKKVNPAANGMSFGLKKEFPLKTGVAIKIVDASKQILL
jgi:hypothetical protein